MSLTAEPNLSQENGACVAPEHRLQLSSGPPVKALDGRSQVSTPCVGGVGCSASLPYRCQEGFGNGPERHKKLSKERLMGPSNLKTNFSAKKMAKETVKAESPVPASGDTYPEIEKGFFSFHPLDFESCNLPEEQQTAFLTSTGEPLMLAREEKGTTMMPGAPSPREMPPSSPWGASQ